MERTLRSHIEELNRIRQQLNEELMHENDLRLRNELETKARAAEMALRHYQTALELERSLARP